MSRTVYLSLSLKNHTSRWFGGILETDKVLSRSVVGLTIRAGHHGKPDTRPHTISPI